MRVPCCPVKIMRVQSRCAPIIHYKQTMYSVPPAEWVEECRQAWMHKMNQEPVACTEALPPPHALVSKGLSTGARPDLPDTDRKQKPAPADGVSFF